MYYVLQIFAVNFLFFNFQVNINLYTYFKFKKYIFLDKNY